MLAVAIVFAAFVLYSLVEIEPVEITRSGLVRDNGKVYVAGEVRDTSSKELGAVNIELHYFDRSGHPLGQDTLTIRDLKPGEPREFRGPSHDLLAVSEYSIYVNHGRNPYGN